MFGFTLLVGLLMIRSPTSLKNSITTIEKLFYFLLRLYNPFIGTGIPQCITAITVLPDHGNLNFYGTYVVKTLTL